MPVSLAYASQVFGQVEPLIVVASEPEKINAGLGDSMLHPGTRARKS